MPRRTPTSLPEIGIDQIPTAPSPGKARVIGVATLALAFLAIPVWLEGPEALRAFLANKAELAILWQKLHLERLLLFSFQLIGVVGLLCALAGTLSLVVRKPVAKHLLKFSLAVVLISMGFHIWVAWQAAFAIPDSGIEINDLGTDRLSVFKFWWQLAGPAVGIGIYVFWLQLMLRCRSVHAVFTGQAGREMTGDQILENLRTHGRDPRHRRSLYWSIFTHFFFIILLPWLLGLLGSVEPYKVPQGSGNPVVAMVKMVKPEKKKKKTLSLRPNSAIIFDQPDLDNTEVDQVMEQQTQLTYTASNAAKAGNIGKGGGDEGGWPEGMDDYKIRFIRLEHSGQGWDDGMNQTNADINFLRAFAQATGFKKIANKGESHSIALLNKYPDDGFPPFVYLTGDSLGRTSSSDIQTVREYCLKGGMLIADAGSAGFHRSFVHFMRQVFPDKPLVDIADDDMIYQLPYAFPNGAPAFWAHGGRRGLGVKHEGRWVVYYHPGDMNDAWKNQEYSKVTPDMRDAAMKLGVNLIYYAFNQWDDAVSKAKKNND